MVHVVVEWPLRRIGSGSCHTFFMYGSVTIFLISTQNDARGYQKSCPWENKLQKCNKISSNRPI